jgi:hypothetical protein
MNERDLEEFYKEFIDSLPLREAIFDLIMSMEYTQYSDVFYVESGEAEDAK